MENASIAVQPAGGNTLFCVFNSVSLAFQLLCENPAEMQCRKCELCYFEEKAERVVLSPEHCTTHLSIGMETSPIRSIGALGPDDLIIHNNLDQGHTIAKKADIMVMIGKLLGKGPNYRICFCRKEALPTQILATVFSF